MKFYLGSLSGLALDMTPGDYVETVSELLERRVRLVNTERTGIRIIGVGCILFFSCVWFVTRELNGLSLGVLCMGHIGILVFLVCLRSLLVLYLKQGNPSFRIARIIANWDQTIAKEVKLLSF